MNVSLYPAAATNIKGDFQPLGAGHSNLLSSWTTVTPNSLKIAAHSNAIATVTITVPAAAPTGQQVGIVWASIKTSPNSNAVGGVSRVGIRMYDPVGNAPDNTPGMSSSPTSAHNTSLPLELTGLALLLLSALLVGLFIVRKERKRAKKRRRKRGKAKE